MMGNIERPECHRNPLDVQREERERLREVTEAQSRAIEALRQRNIALRDQLRGAVGRAQLLRALNELGASVGRNRTIGQMTRGDDEGNAMLDALAALLGGR